VLIFLTYSSYCQIVFNRIIPDTVSHINNSIIESDNGYIMLTGTSNEFNVRCFSIRIIDIYGNEQIKKLYGVPINEFWEGHYNCLKKTNNQYYSVGTYKHLSQNTIGVFLNFYNSNLDTTSQAIICDNNVSKAAFNALRHSSGDYYITGWLYDSSMDDAYLLFIKTDSNGNFIWQKVYGLRYEYGEQLIETSDSNILIGGGTFSFPTTITDEDWYLIKLDTAGNVIWQNGFGRPGFLNYDGPVKGLIETSDSNYVACGGYPALRSDTDTYWDGCLRKVSKDGDLMWERFYRSYLLSHTGNHHFNNGISAILEKNTDIYILGRNFNYISWKDRAYLAKLDKNGNVLWKRDYYAIDTNTYSQYLVAMQLTSDDGFILAGYGNDYDSHGYFPSQQAWLVKTDSLGIDGLCYTEPPALNVDIVLPATVNCSDTITVYAYIAGKSAPYTIETSVGQIIDSIYYPPLFVPVEIGLSLAEIDYGGNIIYSQQITEATLSNHEWGQCIAKPVEFYTPHTSASQQINITVTDAYGESKTITKEVLVNDNCGSGIAKEAVNSVNVYPNPAVDNLYLDISGMVVSAPLNHLAVNCEIYNSLGQLVETLQLSNNLTIINVKDFASGMYQVKIVDGSGNVLVKSFEKH